MINWNTIISECGIKNLTRFAYGNMTKRAFRSYGTNCRRISDTYNMNALQDMAQRAVRHRTNANQRRLILR